MSNFNEIEFDSESEDYPVASQLNSRIKDLISDRSMDRAKVVVKKKVKKSVQRSDSSGDEEEQRQTQRKKAIPKKAKQAQEEATVQGQGKETVQGRGRGRPSKSSISGSDVSSKINSQRVEAIKEEKVDVEDVAKSILLLSRIIGTKK